MSVIQTQAKHYLTKFGALRWKMAAAGILCGIVSGLLVVAYRIGMEKTVEFSRWVMAQLHLNLWLILPWLAAALVVGLATAWMVKRVPMASGSGIPQVSGVVIHGLTMKWQEVLPVRFLGGFLAGLFGLSLGREGPSIQIGASGAQFVVHRLRKGRRNDFQEHYVVTAGAAAGLSAAFSAPLSGMMFALEEVHRSFSPMVLISATAASLTADFVSKYCIGMRPVLDFITMPQLPLHEYWWMIPLGIVAGLLGSLTNRSLLGFQTLYTYVPQRWRTTIALLIALPVGYFLPQVLGGGASLIALSEHAQTGIGMLLLLLVVKILFTSTSFGSGMPGGIFMPILAIGALGGGICGSLARDMLAIPQEIVPLFAVCVMAGTLSAAVKTPITAILLTVEMTGSLVHMLPVAGAAFIALLVSDMTHTKPIYAALLQRYIAQNGKDQATFTHVGSGVMEFPIEMGCPVDNHRVRDVAWPSGCLLVGLRRGEQEIVPRGDTLIRAGDYIIVLFSGEEERHIRQSVGALCRMRDV